MPSLPVEVSEVALFACSCDAYVIALLLLITGEDIEERKCYNRTHLYECQSRMANGDP